MDGTVEQPEKKKPLGRRSELPKLASPHVLDLDAQTVAVQAIERALKFRNRTKNFLGAQAMSLILTCLHQSAIYMHMRTTLIIDDDLLAKARELTGLHEKTAVLHAGLEALIAREHARRLAALGGTQRSLRPIPRRRTRATG